MKFSIPFQSLSKKRRGEHTRKVGRPCALSEQEEQAIVSGILTLSDWGFPVVRCDLRRIISYYVSKLDITDGYLKNGVPGPDFIKGFIRRHRKFLQCRVVANYSRERATLNAMYLK